jgi:ATP-binding cassette, subfamily B, bacterial PglK
MSASKNYSYVQTILWIVSRLPKQKRIQLMLLASAQTISALVEAGSLGAIAIFASAVSDPVVVLKSSYLKTIMRYLNIDYVLSTQNLILSTGILVIILVVVKNTVKMIVTYLTVRVGGSISVYFGEFIINGFLNMPYEWHISENSADLVTTINWRSVIGNNILLPSLTLLCDIVMISIMLVGLLVVQPVMVVVIIIVIGGLAKVIFRVSRKSIDKIATVARDYIMHINKESTMAIHGVRDVKIAKKEKTFVKKFLANAGPLAHAEALQSFYMQAPVFFLEISGFLVLVVSIWVMMLVSESSAAAITGTISLLAVTAWRVLPAINRILGSFMMLRKSYPLVDHLKKYITQIEKRSFDRKTTQERKTCIEILSKNVVFKNVGYSYSGTKKKALHNISFAIDKGKSVGVIGASGAGKSTLVDLITGLFSPTSGEILVDGKSLNKELLSNWLGQIGYVSQSPYIYDGTLAENVAFGCSGAEISCDRVVECCQMASMGDFFDDLPDGVDTYIGERGVKLSGGQQQRVAIARALYHQPEIMIFDEATSSLDSKSEMAIQDTIYSFKGTSTLIIIAHRLSTVINCDYLIWLESGRIKMMGNPDEVLDKYQDKNYDVEASLQKTE